MTDNDRAPEAERTVTLKKVEVHSGAGLVHVNLTTSLTTPDAEDRLIFLRLRRVAVRPVPSRALANR